MKTLQKIFSRGLGGLIALVALVAHDAHAADVMVRFSGHFNAASYCCEQLDPSQIALVDGLVGQAFHGVAVYSSDASPYVVMDDGSHVPGGDADFAAFDGRSLSVTLGEHFSFTSSAPFGTSLSKQNVPPGAFESTLLMITGTGAYDQASTVMPLLSLLEPTAGIVSGVLAFERRPPDTTLVLPDAASLAAEYLPVSFSVNARMLSSPFAHYSLFGAFDTLSISSVPLPPSAFLCAAALLSIAGLRRRRAEFRPT